MNAEVREGSAQGSSELGSANHAAVATVQTMQVSDESLRLLVQVRLPKVGRTQVRHLATQTP